uniref:Uncharacterized protein n=1 Tax=Anguilla anguilla TaxID=7936 RepID=A0A0E9Q6A0_ANGAN
MCVCFMPISFFLFYVERDTCGLLLLHVRLKLGPFFGKVL